MSIVLKIKEGYKKNKVPYIIFPIASIIILVIISYSSLNLFGYFDEAQSNTLTTIKLPDPIEKRQKSKLELQSQFGKDRIVTNREFASTLSGDIEFIDTKKNTMSKEIILDDDGNSYSNDNYNKIVQLKADSMLESFNNVHVVREKKIAEKRKEQKVQAQLDELKEHLRELKTANKVEEQKLQVQRELSAVASQGGVYNNNDLTHNNTSSNIEDSFVSNVANPASVHNGGYVQTTRGNSSRGVTVVAAGQGYITSIPTQTKVINMQNTIPSIVDHDHILYPGSLLQIRMLKPIHLHGLTIPVNHYVYGIARLGRERLYIDFSSIEFNDNIIPFKAKVYDYDGLVGLDAPGTQEADIVRYSGSDAVQSTTVGGYEKTDNEILDNIKKTGTNGALQAIKNIASLKIVQQKVKIKAGHKLFLILENN